jgi:hypothetical protein
MSFRIHALGAAPLSSPAAAAIQTEVRACDILCSLHHEYVHGHLTIQPAADEPDYLFCSLFLFLFFFFFFFPHSYFLYFLHYCTNCGCCLLVLLK